MGHGEQGQVMNAFYQLVRSKHVNDKLFFLTTFFFKGRNVTKSISLCGSGYFLLAKNIFFLRLYIKGFFTSKLSALGNSNS